jgi:hypothetical protein
VRELGVAGWTYVLNIEGHSSPYEYPQPQRHIAICECCLKLRSMLLITRTPKVRQISQRGSGGGRDGASSVRGRYLEGVV